MGEFAPYQLVNGELITDNHSPDNQSKRLLRSETGFIITEMLTTLQLPANTVRNPEAFESSMNLPKIAWKTGTSYGHRDAWCIGYSPELTIGVWLGNFDGKGSAMLSGTDAATPILFALFTALTGQETHRWFTKPKRLKTRDVCALSGAPVSLHCPTRKSDVYISGVSPIATCTIHKRVYIDEATGYSLCSHCRGSGSRKEKSLNRIPITESSRSWGMPTGIHTRGSPYGLHTVDYDLRTDNPFSDNSIIFEEWPAEAATWLAENGFAVPILPEHNPFCNGAIAGTAPVILSPVGDTVYYIRPGIPLEHQKIRLSASASNRTQELFWFLDGALIFKGNAGQQYWLTPVKGKHLLTCVDAEGRSASLPLHISVIPRE